MTATKQLYVALNDANRPTLTVRTNWTVSKKITEAEAIKHLNEKGLAEVLAGKEHTFTEADQSYRQLMRLFA